MTIVTDVKLTFEAFLSGLNHCIGFINCGIKTKTYLASFTYYVQNFLSLKIHHNSYTDYLKWIASWNKPGVETVSDRDIKNYILPEKSSPWAMCVQFIYEYIILLTILLQKY